MIICSNNIIMQKKKKEIAKMQTLD
uniref:Uncharacterized protein n=1 Tax=Arundo donax TaxID=35708 RepID=A0A0A9FN97_ARUDO